MKVFQVALSTTLVVMASYNMFGQGDNGVVEAFTTKPALLPRTSLTSLFATVENNQDEDCGCTPPVTIFAGNPSSAAKADIKHRTVLSDAPIYNVDGTKTHLDSIIGTIEENERIKQTSMVVFLRSLG